MSKSVHSSVFVASVLVIFVATVGIADNAVVEIGTSATMQSQHLDREMRLVIEVPEDYKESGKNYPLMVVMGSDFRTQFAHVATTVAYMGAKGEIPEMIIVGVDLPNGNGELIPQRAGQPRSPVPDRYLRFLAEELAPFIDASYRTNGYRILYGASNSGLFVIYGLLSQPDAFDAYFASSPMLGWCFDLIADLTKSSLSGDNKHAETFLHMVYSDDDYQHVCDGVPRFETLLDEISAPWLKWQTELRRNEGHVPTLDVALGLKALFPDFNPEIELTTLRDMKSHYSKLSTRYGFEIKIPVNLVMDLGFKRFSEKDYAASREIFETAVEEYPKDTRGCVGLGVVARDTGNPEQAVTWFKKALEVDPDNVLATRLLTRLQSQSVTDNEDESPTP